jgi:probable lipoprotein (TIGR04455 family)
LTRFTLLFVSLVLGAAACGSPLRQVYDMRGYSLLGPDTVKHVAVLAWAPPTAPKLAELLAREAGDVVKLRRDYLVHKVGVMERSWTEACRLPEGEGTPALDLQGIIAIRLLDVTEDAGAVDMRLAMELYRCKDGALVWRADATAKVASADADLKELVRTYVQSIGDVAQKYASPTFVLIKALVEVLPNPVLTDDEVGQKIELES